MALVELKVRLNPSEAVSSLAAGVRGPVSRLQQMGLPIAPSVSGSLSGTVDLGALRAAVERVAEGITGRDLDIPSPDLLVAKLRSILELIEDFDPRAMETSIRSILTQTSGELKKPSSAGFDVMVERILLQLGASPEGRELGKLILRLASLVGVDAAIITDAKSLLPAIRSAIRGIGAIMRIESALSEAERLSVAIAGQLDADVMAAELETVRANLSYAVRQLQAAASTPAIHIEAERATLGALEQLDLVRESFARRFAFAELTLIHANFSGTLVDVTGGLDDAAGVDLAAAGAAVGKVVDKLIPAFSFPLPPAPAASFDALLTLLEGKVQALAQRIEQVDVARLGAPVTALTSKITQPIREIEQLGTELTLGAQQAVQGVAGLVSDLPTGEVTNAVATAIAPVRTAMTSISGVVQDADATVRQFSAQLLAPLTEAEQAIDAFTGAIKGVVDNASQFVDALHLQQTIGAVAEQLQTVRSAIEQASVRPYFSAATDAIDTTASVLEKVPVVMLPDDIKQEFDALVEPIRSLNIDAVAGEVESWFALQDGKFPFEAPLQQELKEIRDQLTALIAAISEHHPRLLAPMIDAELAPLRAQTARLDLGNTFEPIEKAIRGLKDGLHGVDPRAALAPVHDAMTALGARVQSFSPDTLIAPLQDRIDAARGAVIDTLRLEQASRALNDLEREAVRLVTLLDPRSIEPALVEALAAARMELRSLDAATMSDWGGTLVSSILGGDGVRRRPAAWRNVLAWILGDGGATRLKQRAIAVSDNLKRAQGVTASLDLDGAAVAVHQGLRDLTAALNALPADAPVRLRLAGPLARRGDDGGYVKLNVNRARFSGELTSACTASAALLQLDLSRVDVVTAALRVVAGPVVRLRSQLLGTLKHFGIKRPGDGLGAVLAEVLEVATAERLAGIIVPVFTALRGRAQALLAAVLGPLRTALDDLVRLLKLVDLRQLTKGVNDVLAAGAAQIAALDPVRILEPALADFDALKAAVESFDPLGALKSLVATLRQTIDRILSKLSAENLLAPASQLFDKLVQSIQGLDVDPLVEPLLAALRTLATDIRTGIDQLRDALKRLQAAIPSTDGLALAGVVDVDIDVDIGF